MEEVARHDGRDGSYWLVLDGEVYDYTAFAPKHPGGSSILHLAAGREATVLFESYHPGASLERARRVLTRKAQHLGSVVPDQVEPYGDPAFFEAVRSRVDAKLKEHGLGYHSGIWRTGIEAAITVLLSLTALYFRGSYGSYIAAVVGGVLMARLGFLMHSGNHAALGRRRWPNVAAGHLMEFIGGSSIIWQYAHQVAHHGRPNIYGRDNDCEIGAPLLRFHPEIPRRPLHKIQHIGLAIGMSIGLFKWIISDVLHLHRGRVVNATFHLPKSHWYRSLLYKALWVTFHMVIPMALTGFWTGLATTFVLMAVGAYYMEGVFIVNHLQHDLVPPHGRHWAEQQIYGSANWSAGSRWANFVSGGLNHQVEHHLFPSMAIRLYPLIAPVVKETCEEYGLPYRNFPGFFSALWGTVRFLHDLGRPGYDLPTEETSAPAPVELEPQAPSFASPRRAS
ncbi:MAG: fatty acid desaturase [Myxococcota bacterium]